MRKLWIALAGALGVQSGAAAASPGVTLVFIHGIKGSRLVDGQNRLSWLSSFQALGLSAPNLKLPLSRSLEGTQDKDGLKASGILDSITILPWVFEQKIYGPWLEAAQQMGLPFKAYAYDWRRDNSESSAAFERFLDDASRENGGAKIAVVAHSMGGLITWTVLNRRPELFKVAIFAGVPFKGGIGFLPDLSQGEPTGLNGRILAPEVMGSFPSVYSFFPTEQSGLLDAKGNPIHEDFYSSETWKRRAWALYKNPKAPEPETHEFLDWALDRARKFRGELAPKRGIAYPPLYVVNSSQHSTLQEAKARQDGSWDFENSPHGPGDGRVLEADSHVPGGLPFERIETKANHGDLLNDPAVIEAIRALLRDLLRSPPK